MCSNEIKFIRRNKKYPEDIIFQDKTCIKPICDRKKYCWIVEILKKEAMKSTLPFKHGACIIKGGKILSIGHNYILTKKIGEKYTVHAEVSAIMKLPKKYKTKCETYTLVVIRVNRDNEVRLSKPCINCTHAICKSGIRTAIYSV
ncbi:MAG TPA: hypothetical protein V6C58_17405 [Allocoleopsis sp.]